MAIETEGNAFLKTTAVGVNIIGFRTVLAVFAFVLVLNACSVAGEKKLKTFRSYLSEIGSQLDCYFTVESVGIAGFLNNPILDSVVNVDPKGIQNVGALMAFLKNKIRIPWKAAGKTETIHLIVDNIEHSKSIIRIRDARLSHVTGYALTKKVSVNFDGNPDGLLNLLSTRNPLIQPQVVFTVGMGPIEVSDSQTPITVDVADTYVRDMLTTCIPLSGYNRIIWSSYTDGKAESPVVTVKFHGPRLLSPKRR